MARILKGCAADIMQNFSGERTREHGIPQVYVCAVLQLNCPQGCRIGLSIAWFGNPFGASIDRSVQELLTAKSRSTALRQQIIKFNEDIRATGQETLKTG